jgi:hypothetical protein
MAIIVYFDGFSLYYDLQEPIRGCGVELGMKVGVVNPHPARRRSRAVRSSFFKQLRPSVLPSCQFPPVLKDAQGEIRKPTSW